MFSKRENEESLLVVLRAAGRVLSLVVLFVLLMFYISDGTGGGEIAFREVIGLLFFPIGLSIGLMSGWRSELAGGLVSVLSVAAFYVIYGSVLSGSMQQGWAFLVFAIPGMIFLAYGVLDRIWFHPGHHHASV